MNRLYGLQIDGKYFKQLFQRENGEIYDDTRYDCIDNYIFSPISVYNHLVETMCCSKYFIILPKTFDAKGLADLYDLSFLLPENGRINNIKIGYIHKKCDC